MDNLIIESKGGITVERLNLWQLTEPYWIDLGYLMGVHISDKSAGEVVLDYEFSRRWLWNGTRVTNEGGGLN